MVSYNYRDGSQPNKLKQNVKERNKSKCKYVFTRTPLGIALVGLLRWSKTMFASAGGCWVIAGSISILWTPSTGLGTLAVLSPWRPMTINWQKKYYNFPSKTFITRFGQIMILWRKKRRTAIFILHSKRKGNLFFHNCVQRKQLIGFTNSGCFPSLINFSNYFVDWNCCNVTAKRKQETWLALTIRPKARDFYEVKAESTVNS